MIQLSQYDHDSSSDYGKSCLEECKSSLVASISLEGKPAAGPLPEAVASMNEFLLKNF